MTNSSPPIRVRIAPSPTGPLHVGTARTALFNELFARQAQGTFIVRMEDTDPARSRPEFEQAIVEGLRWLGLKWDEGPDTGGAYGPYRQSERQSLYQAALRQLIDQEKAYYCDCRRTGASSSSPPATGSRTTGSCQCAMRQTELRQNATDQLAIRLKVEPETIAFEDVIRGHVSAHTDSFGGDFIIARSLHNPLYHLAVVVDDAHMRISHVIRGEDHLSNTAKHILLQRALGLPQPVYVHVPLLLNEQRQKLSKRTGETNLLHFREAGFLPEALLNYIALLGWNPKNNEEFFNHDALVKNFSLAGLQQSPAVFSMDKLKAFNRHYLRQLSVKDLVSRLQPFLSESWSSGERLAAAVSTEQARVNTLKELAEVINFLMPQGIGQYPASLLEWRGTGLVEAQDRLNKVKIFIEQLPENFAFTAPELQKHFLDWIDAEKLGRGDTLWPLRVALTGRQHSPGPFEVATILGRSETLERVDNALRKLTS